MSAFRHPPLLVLAGLTLAACQSAPTATGPSGSGVAPTDGPFGTVPGTTDAPLATGYVTGDGDLFLDPIEGLSALPSHVATLTWSFTGTADDQPSTWTETTTLRTAADPATSELVVERTGITGQPARSWQALLDGVLYADEDNAGCSAALPDPARSHVAEPASQLSALIGGVRTGSESIDGVATDAFQFDGRAMGLIDPITAIGHAWISSSDELLLRYDVAIDAGPEYFGDGITGHLDGRYEIHDVGSSVAIHIPDACPAGLIVGPQPTDASSVESAPGRLSLETTLSVERAMAFYRDTSLAFGWKATTSPVLQADPAVAGLEFSWAGLHLTVLITSGVGGSHVDVTARRD